MDTAGRSVDGNEEEDLDLDLDCEKHTVKSGTRPFRNGTGGLYP